MKSKSIDIENRQESLSQVQNQIGNTVLLISVIFGTIATLTSFIRSLQTGLTAANIIHICALVFIISTYLFRIKIKGKTKVFIAIIILILIASAGFYSYGIVSSATVMMLAALVLTTIIFPLGQSLLIILIIMLMIGAGGVLHFTGIAPYSFNVNQYFNQTTSWISKFMGTLMVVAIVTASLRKLHTYLFTLADSLDINRKDLQASNEELQAMNEEFESQNKELYQAHHHLIEHEELFRAVFESANDCIYLVDEKGIVFQCNKQCEALLGASLEGKEPWSYSPENQPGGQNSRERALELFHEINHDGSRQFYWRHQHVNGKHIETEISTSSMKTGDRTFILGIVRDITEQKKLEAQLLQAQKMEALGTLTSGLAHDFNNILGGIIGGVGLIETFIDRSDFDQKDKVKKYTDVITRSTDRASDMIGQLMNLSRNQEAPLQPIDLNVSLENILQIMQNSFPKSVTVTHQSHKGIALVNAEQTQIEQVLLNICINASHAMTIMRKKDKKEGGTLNIAINYNTPANMPSNIKPDAEENTSYYVIQISDTGIGMDALTQSQLFNPFFTTKKKGTGTGLGLSMVYNIIKNHGGLITVYSEPDKGSVFNIYLPELLQSESLNKQKATKETIIPGRGKILVIDDEISQRTITEGMLLECGYQVTLASQGREALEIYEKAPNTFDLVITDLSMPDLDGVEVFQSLQNLNSKIKVIITSGFRDDPRIEKGLTMGISDFIEKPFSIVKLSKVVDQAINL